MSGKDLQKEILDLKSQIKKLQKSNLGLVFEDKPEDVVTQCNANVPVLKEVKSKRIGTDDESPNNLLIEGDNYHSLSVLNYTHKSKIDLIYIDPPYNTGNHDFIYNDQYVDAEDSYRHSKWLSFMQNRLVLARDLLTPEGMIFISIDDNEQAYLRILCNKIFGEQNFIANFKWNRVSKAPSLSGSVRTKYEYVVVYCKGQRIKLFGKNSYNTQGPLWHLPNKHNLLVFPMGSIKIKQTFKKGNYGGTYKVELLDDMVESNGYNKNVVRIKAHSAWGQKKIDGYVKDGFTFEIKKNPTTLYTTLSSEGNYIAPSDLITDEECGVKRNTEASEAIKAMGIPFDYPKPISLIKYLVNMVTHDNKSATVLDFFAGSGTTGHAVIELNAEDAGSRRFILCTNNEDNNGSGKKIATDICYPRIKAVINGYENKKGEKVAGLGGNLSYYKTDLVDIEQIHKIPDEAKIRVTYQAGEMIAVREDTLNEIEKNDWWQIFEGKGKMTAIYFKEDKSKLAELIEKLEKKNLPVALYIFSWGKNEYKGEYSSAHIRVEDIPEPIIEVYKELNRL
ncbi:MAG: site-specific DNA-methyltransferase [Candidatus Paceibacterota bacterium]